jgi:aspartyl protease family protein
MRSVIVFAVVMLLSAALIPKLYESKSVATMAAATTNGKAAEPASSTPYNYHTITLMADQRGHFNVDGLVDGRRMGFMVDTGASVIALRETDASRLGIHPSERDYTARVNTANGTIKAAPVKLDRVEIGGLTVRGVEALVLSDQALSQNLLGMSFLSRLRRVEMGNGRLVLEQ